MLSQAVISFPIRIVRRGRLFTYGASPFSWVPSVCAVSLALVRLKLLASRGELHEVILSGGPGTPARTLHRTVYRYDFRFCDVFGVSPSGRSRIFDIFHFSRPSSATGRSLFRVSYLRGKLLPENLKIELVGSLTELDLQALAERLEEEFLLLLLGINRKVPVPADKAA